MTRTNRERLDHYAAELRRPAGEDPSLDALWPAIQSRIEGGMQGEMPVVPQPARWRPRVALGAAAAVAVAAAVVLAFTLTGVIRNRTQEPTVVITAAADSAAALRAIDDSVRAYQEETRILLDRLEIARAVLPPQAARAVDHDLQAVDSAIAELNAAIERHPSDASLRRLLAASYRQKLD
ncbi:MAG: hypothetical protein ACREMU_10075, partial [Gemmatimonadaceae bacterium]